MAGIGLFPAFDAMRQSLPMVQAFVIMAIIICLPIVTVMSSYDLKVLMLLTFVLLGAYALSFWWELARWIDSYLFDALYNSDTHSRWNIMGLQNTTDDLIIEIVGMALASISSKGSAEAKSAGQKGGDIVTSAATKGTK